MYPGGADRVRCAECGTVSPVGREQEFAYASCGGCGALLMYPAGAMHVRCAGCQAITRVTQHATGASGDATSASPIKAIFVEQPDRTMQLGVFQLA